MRIAMVVPGGVDRSGEFRVIPALVALIGRLSQCGDVHVFALHQEAEYDEWNLAGARIHNIGLRHTRMRGIRAICAMHRAQPFDLVHAIWSGSCGLIAVAAGKLLGIPSIVHIAGGELVSMPKFGFGGMRTWRGRLREAMVLRGASVITAASAPVIEALAALGLAAQRVPLGVDLALWLPRTPMRRDRARAARLIHVASLNRVKDQATLLRAAASLTRSGVRFELDIVGADTLNGAMSTLAEDLGLSDVVNFRGFMTQRQLRPLMLAADLMVHTSRYETGPVVLLEAAVSGVPTVGTSVGHIAEWAPHAAVAVPVGDWLRLAYAIERLLGDENLRLAIAGAAFARATSEDADYTALLFRSVYRSLIHPDRSLADHA
ncbi:MAG: hexosyltransferase [Gammaproteobacteria bacterium]|nr:hexosyltransferase [Gammaproteobacteria bacterium]